MPRKPLIELGCGLPTKLRPSCRLAGRRRLDARSGTDGLYTFAILTSAGKHETELVPSISHFPRDIPTMTGGISTSIRSRLVAPGRYRDSLNQLYEKYPDIKNLDIDLAHGSLRTCAFAVAVLELEVTPIRRIDFNDASQLAAYLHSSTSAKRIFLAEAFNPGNYSPMIWHLLIPYPRWQCCPWRTLRARLALLLPP